MMEDMVKRRQFPQFLAPYCIAFEKSVGAVVFRVVDGKTEYLLLKYRNGHWEFPRGKAEDNESEEETMRREIYEETGIDTVHIVDAFRETMTFSYTAHGKEREERKREKSCIFIRKKAIFYLAEAKMEDVAVSHEHQEFTWMPFEEAYQRLTYENAKHIFIAAHKHLHTAKS